MNFTLSDFETGTTEDLGSKPKFSKVIIDNYGLVRVEFSNEIKIPVYTEFDDTDLNIKVIPSGLVEIDKLTLTWEVQSFESKFMMIQIFFDNPLFISSNGKNDREKLLIQCKDPSEFVSVSDESKMDLYHSLETDLPPQLPPGGKNSFA